MPKTVAEAHALDRENRNDHWKKDYHSYYEYVLIYVDDILCMLHDPKESKRKIDKFFPVK
jgi:hypothetical protein